MRLGNYTCKVTGIKDRLIKKYDQNKTFYYLYN